MLSRLLFLLIAMSNVTSQGVLPTIQARLTETNVSRLTETNVSHGYGPSPKCWDIALQLFQTESQKKKVDGIAFCSAMPETFQRILALEITKCHMVDVGPLYRPENAEICNKAPSSEKLAMVTCLEFLTEVGLTTYTLYMAHIHGLCNRLNAESLLKYQRDTQRDLSARYAEFTKNHIKDLEDHRVLLRDGVLMTQRILHDIEAMASNVTHLIDNSSLEELSDKIITVTKRVVDKMTMNVVQQIDNHIQGLFDQKGIEMLRLQELRHNETQKENQSYYEAMSNNVAQLKELTKQMKEWISPSHSLHPMTWSPTLWQLMTSYSSLGLEILYFFCFLCLSMVLIHTMAILSFYPSSRMWLGRIFLFELSIELLFCFTMTETSRKENVFRLRIFSICVDVLVGVTCAIAYPVLSILMVPFKIMKSLWKITCLNLFPKKSSSNDMNETMKSASSDMNKPKKSTTSDLNKVLLNSMDAAVGKFTDHRVAAITIDHNDISDFGQSGDDDSINLVEDSSVASKLDYRSKRVPKIDKRNRLTQKGRTSNF